MRNKELVKAVQDRWDTPSDEGKELEKIVPNPDGGAVLMFIDGTFSRFDTTGVKLTYNIDSSEANKLAELGVITTEEALAIHNEQRHIQYLARLLHRVRELETADEEVLAEVIKARPEFVKLINSIVEV